MRILYSGTLNEGGTSLQRMRALGELGHEVTGFDMLPYVDWGGRYLGFPFRRLLSGPPVTRANRGLMEAFERVKPDLVWVDKGRYVRPRTLERMRQAGARLVHFTPDPSFSPFMRSRLLDGSIPLYDVMVTNKSYDVEEYRRRGCRHLLFQPPAYDKHTHRKINLSGKDREKYQSDVAFIGHWEPPRETLLNQLRLSGVRLSIWGPEYQNCKNRELVSECWKNEGVYGEDYAKALSGAKISLSFLSKRYPDQTTTRTFEIPACGSLLLTERTGEQRALFREDQEAVYFADGAELVSKVKYYLSHEKERKRIAEAGYRRCVRGKNSYHDRLKEVLAAAGVGKRMVEKSKRSFTAKATPKG